MQPNYEGFVKHKKERAVLCIDYNCFALWYVENKLNSQSKPKTNG